MTTPRRRPHHAVTTPSQVDHAVDEGLTRAAAAFFPEAAAVQPVGGRSHLARVETAAGVWCVRRWPASAPPERIAFVHALLSESRSNGIDFVPSVAVLPDGGSVLALGGALYDARSWLPGRTHARGADAFDEQGRVIDRPSPLPTAALNAATRAIAALHTATETVARQQGAPQAPLDGVLRAVRSAWERDRERLRRLAPRTPHIQRWIRSGENVLDGAVESLTTAEFLRTRPKVVGHLNLWPAHLLFARVEGQERISGLLDFAEAAVSSPLVDLAQLVAHFGGWNGAVAEDALGAYAEVRPLAPEERRLLPAVAGLDLVAETGRLLALGYASPAIAGGPSGDTIRASAAAMLLSLEAVAPAVQRGDRPEPSRSRKWVHRPRSSTRTPRHRNQ